jgi:hypothetical protein
VFPCCSEPAECPNTNNVTTERRIILNVWVFQFVGILFGETKKTEIKFNVLFEKGGKIESNFFRNELEMASETPLGRTCYMPMSMDHALLSELH